MCLYQHTSQAPHAAYPDRRPLRTRASQPFSRVDGRPSLRGPARKAGNKPCLSAPCRTFWRRRAPIPAPGARLPMALSIRMQPRAPMPVADAGPTCQRPPPARPFFPFFVKRRFTGKKPLHSASLYDILGFVPRVMTIGSRAASCCESCQGRKAAALNRFWRAPRGMPGSSPWDFCFWKPGSIIKVGVRNKKADKASPIR